MDVASCARACVCVCVCASRRVQARMCACARPGAYVRVCAREVIHRHGPIGPTLQEDENDSHLAPKTASRFSVHETELSR